MSDLEPGDILHRADDHWLSGDDSPPCMFTSWRVAKRTRCGVWLEDTGTPSRKHFMRTGRKDGRLWARPTELEALQDYIERKRMHVWHAQAQAEDAQRRYELAVAALNKLRPAPTLPFQPIETAP